MRPGDRVEDLEGGEALGVLLVEDALAGGGDGLRAGGGVDDDRQRPLPAPAPEPLDHLVRLVAVGVAKPFELQGRPQQEPATSSGIQTGRPARRETSTSASTGEPPKIRLVQEGT